jgi:rfaE bifunctional protein kinase chain/domain|tara:strand:+ start:4680 stop:5624 length:945 start_codon:yes stop_codon:yes gene_type:complete
MKLDFSDIKVLLIGDFMVDHYVMGTSNRLSPEAPVPVVLPLEEYSIPGGAGNVALNLSLLGSKVSCLGVIGQGSWGKKLTGILKKNNVDVSFLIKSNFSHTTLKKRVYIDEKQILRIDREKKIDNSFNKLINNKVKEIINDFDVIILSDYDKGVLNENTINFVINNANIPVIVDPKKNDFSIYQGATILTPNINELKNASKFKVENDKSIITSSQKIIKKNNLKFIVTTKGEKGMTVVGEDFSEHISTAVVENPDVTGAGDTVVASLALTYILKKDIFFAIKIANYAANYVVKKVGTAQIDIANLNKIIKEKKV